MIQERAEFQQTQPTLRSEDLVFIDEAGVNLSMTLAYGRAMRGERVVEHRPSIRTAKTSIVGAITTQAVLSICTVSGSYNADRFLEWLTTELLPKLPTGKILVWDNVKFHSNAAVLAAVAAAGCRVLKMPPYSPDLNPIEECWSKLKQFVRAAKARTQGALEVSLQMGAEMIETSDLIGWIGHAGYHVATEST